mgnify:CR=1 FL=1
MRTILRFDEDDLRQLVAEKTGADLSDIVAVNTEECVGYGMNEARQPVFYIEVEKKEK